MLPPQNMTTVENNSSIEVSQHLSRPHTYDICFFVLHLCFGTMSVTSSVVLLIGMKKLDLLKNGCMMTLAHFAICDILNGVLNLTYVPWVLLFQTDFVPRSFPGSVNIFCEWSRKTFLVFMALTRFWAVVFPFSAKVYMGNKVFHLWLHGLWGVCCLVCMPFWVNKAIVFSYIDGGWKYRENVPAWVMNFGFVTNLLPTLTMITLYPICFYKILAMKKKFSPPQQQTSEESSTSTPLMKHTRRIVVIAKKERNMLWLFTICSLVFTLYWTPFYFAKIFKFHVPMWYTVFEVMRDVQSVYNPFMYYWCHPQLRNAIRSALGISGLWSKDSKYNSTRDSDVRINGHHHHHNHHHHHHHGGIKKRPSFP